MVNLISQRWFQVLMGVLVVIGLGVGIYFYGKSAGRAAAQTKFDERQAELLKKSQAADARADQQKALADSATFYAQKMSEDIKKDRKTALLNQSIYEEAFNQEKKEIDLKYEKDKDYINSDLSACQRCRDLCRRAARLESYGPEFAGAQCDASSCNDACPAGQ